MGREDRRHRVAAVVAVLLLVALAVVLTYVFPFRQILAQGRAVELAEEKLRVLKKENARLGELAEALQTPTEVERMAREDFGLVRPGEVAYVVVSPAEELEDRSAEEETGAPPQRRWWERGWDFLTGRDLVPATPG